MKKILIVDQITATLEQGKNILSRADFRVFTASSGEEALELHRAQHMDLIIVDVALQGMSVDNFCSAVRDDKLLRHVSIIMLGAGSDSERQLSARCKINSYMTKPIRQSLFLDTVSKLLDIPARKSYRALLKVSVTGKFNEEPFFCNSRNISTSGVLIETGKVFARGDRISCYFFLPGSGQVVVDAEVTRVEGRENDFQYGLRFLDLKPAYRTAIEKLIKTRNH